MFGNFRLFFFFLNLGIWKTLLNSYAKWSLLCQKSSICNREIGFNRQLKRTMHTHTALKTLMSDTYIRNYIVLFVLKTLQENQVLLIGKTSKLAGKPEPNALQQLWRKQSWAVGSKTAHCTQPLFSHTANGCIWVSPKKTKRSHPYLQPYSSKLLLAMLSTTFS